jgi:hypothetical protein
MYNMFPFENKREMKLTLPSKRPYRLIGGSGGVRQVISKPIMTVVKPKRFY